MGLDGGNCFIIFFDCSIKEIIYTYDTSQKNLQKPVKLNIIIARSSLCPSYFPFKNSTSLSNMAEPPFLFNFQCIGLQQVHPSTLHIHKFNNFCCCLSGKKCDHTIVDIQLYYFPYTSLNNTFSMSFMNQQSQKQSLSVGTLSCLGLSAVVAVSAQTLSLSWINNLVQMQTAQGLSTFQMLRRILTSKEALLLYKGQMARFRYSSLARFGDLVSNYTVIRFFQNHSYQDVRATPLFLQSAFSWILASTWRLTLLPLDLLERSNLWVRPSFHRLLTKLNFIKEKRWKMDIVPLYSWLAVQNYLMAYTEPVEYRKDRKGALIRNSAIGFASMSAYEIYANVRKLWSNCSERSLRRAGTQIYLKGLHGVVFCNVTQLVKQYFEVGKQ